MSCHSHCRYSQSVFENSSHRSIGIHWDWPWFSSYDTCGEHAEVNRSQRNTKRLKHNVHHRDYVIQVAEDGDGCDHEHGCGLCYLHFELQSAHAVDKLRAMAGEGVDPRDERAMRSSVFSLLLDWDGQEMKNIYAPLTDQFGFIFTALLAVFCAYIVWKVSKKWRDAAKPPFKPYKVIKPPATVFLDSEKGAKKKRVVAVIGGTGFVGSNLVDELVKLDEYYVYVLGRTFRKERTNPNADALIQVDMKDMDGLERAFQGVDSVINASVISPTCFTTAQDMWQLNRFGLENIVLACQKAKVKNLVHIAALHMEGKLQNRSIKALFDAVMWGEKYVCEKNSDDFRTCVVSPGNMFGLNSYFDDLFTGKLRSSIFSDSKRSFTPVCYAARALIAAEAKLVEGADTVCGKILPLVGEPMTMTQFLTLPTWPHKVSRLPMWQFKAVAYFNLTCAKLFGYAPLGAELSPGFFEFFELTEAKYENYEEVYEILGIGPPAPRVEDYIKECVEKIKERKTKK